MTCSLFLGGGAVHTTLSPAKIAMASSEIAWIYGQCTFNSLPAIDAHERQFFDKLLWGSVTSTIFVRC
jgi:hypothetical protein